MSRAAEAIDLLQKYRAAILGYNHKKLEIAVDLREGEETSTGVRLHLLEDLEAHKATIVSSADLVRRVFEDVGISPSMVFRLTSGKDETIDVFDYVFLDPYGTRVRDTLIDMTRKAEDILRTGSKKPSARPTAVAAPARAIPAPSGLPASAGNGSWLGEYLRPIAFLFHLKAADYGALVLLAVLTVFGASTVMSFLVEREVRLRLDEMSEKGAIVTPKMLSAEIAQLEAKSPPVPRSSAASSAPPAQPSASTGTHAGAPSSVTGNQDCSAPPTYSSKTCVVRGGDAVEPNIMLAIIPQKAKYDSLTQPEYERVARAFSVDPFQKWTSHLAWIPVDVFDRRELLLRDVDPDALLDVCDWLKACAEPSKLEAKFIKCEARFLRVGARVCPPSP